ncbi:mucin-19-like isoform X2 [Sipha flava]|uniref:Mucin-19-like isoform X2 n=2 Tax=Sipha flava TaxID=143950 RepID=A0A8B8FDT4_9HEMI|nr:mucin-19-like isoform X2 [Sipha flava]
MWWPRPRWKSDLFTYCTLLLFITITTTSDAVMADEGQHCGGANMSAVVWTTALCTTLLVLVVVAIYFIYCRRRENDWSSLWWKNNSDKNLVLQTSLPTKDQQQKTGGTDNPAFLVDTYIGDRVGKTGLTKIVRLPQSTVNGGSLGIELTKESDKQIYTCKHSDGSKERLVALRLVFDKDQQQQQCGPPSDLSRALVELSSRYGLRVELETEGEVAVVAQPTVAAEKSDEETVKLAKPNLLSTVRDKAQRLWHQGQVVFKGVDRADIENDAGDLESAESGRAATGAAPMQKLTCTVTTVDETATAVQREADTRNGSGSLRYRTLEYGASPGDAAAYSSPDSGVQCCSVNVPEPIAVAPVSSVMAVAAAAAAVADVDVAPDRGAVAAASDRDAIVSGRDVTSTAPDPQHAAVAAPDKHAVVGNNDDDEKLSTTKPKHTAPTKPNRNEPKTTAPTKPDRDEPKHTAPTKPDCDEPKTTAPTKLDRDEPKTPAPIESNHDERKHTGANPPPPPPRKYSAPVVPSVVTVPRSTASSTADATTVIATDTDTAIATDAATVTDAVQRPSTVSDASPALPTTGPPRAMNEIRMDDDYYWCTTTAMAAPQMSTFGKSPSATGDTAEATNRNGNAAVRNAAATVDEKSAAVDGKYAAVAMTADDVGRDVVSATGTTTSIEDASLPSFSSDEDEDDDDNGAFTDNKAKLPAGTTVEPQNGSGDKACNREVGISSGCKNVAAAKADCDAGPTVAESKSPTRLPTLRLSLSSPLSTTATTSCCSSSASSTSSSPTNNSSSNHNNNNNNNSPIVSKIPVRRQSAGSSIGAAVVSSPMPNGTTKKSIPLPLSRSGSRLAMWSSAN